VDVGDILFAMIGTIGNPVIVKETQTFSIKNVALFKFSKSSALNNRYFRYALCSEVVTKQLSKVIRGGTQQFVSLGSLRQLKIPVPPLNEQKRIADKLDALLRRVDACKERLERVPTLLKRFRQSVLAAATSGKLTEDWIFHETSWKQVKLGSILQDLRYGTSQKCSYERKGHPVLRIPNIGNNEISLEDLKFGEFSDSDYERYRLKEGDLLLIRSNGSVELVGKTAIVSNSAVDFLYAGYLIRLRVDEKVANPKYILACLTSPQTRAFIELTARSTSGVHNINSVEIKSISVRLPSLKEQDEIVRRLQIVQTLVERIESQVIAGRNMTGSLAPAILAKAFQGELVPQDPNDEPATLLLERLQRTGAENDQRTPRTKTVKIPKSKGPRDFAEVLKSFDQGLKPNQLLDESGYNLKEIEEFFRTLAADIEAGKVRELRLDDGEVLLLRG
jgi:type I restriction enzyme S subunit